MTPATTVPNDAFFYHTIDLPGHPPILGQWDLRANVDEYLGRITLAGKRVLEIGAANGFLSFHMEKRGASVVPYDLSPAHLPDVMRYPGLKVDWFLGQCRSVVAGLNRAWSFAHDALGSSLTLRHGTVYEIPNELGRVEVAVFGSVLQHLRDPYSALASAARLTTERIVVTDVLASPLPRLTLTGWRRWLHGEAAPLEPADMVFNPTLNKDPCVWWSLSPAALKPILTAVGFPKATVTYHEQLANPGLVPWGAVPREEYNGIPVMVRLFTIVAERG